MILAKFHYVELWTTCFLGVAFLLLFLWMSRSEHTSHRLFCQDLQIFADQNVSLERHEILMRRDQLSLYLGKRSKSEIDYTAEAPPSQAFQLSRVLCLRLWLLEKVR